MLSGIDYESQLFVQLGRNWIGVGDAMRCEELEDLAEVSLHETFRFLYQDAAAMLWAGAESGVLRFHEEQWEFLQPHGPQAYIAYRAVVETPTTMEPPSVLFFSKAFHPILIKILDWQQLLVY